MKPKKKFNNNFTQMVKDMLKNQEPVTVVPEIDEEAIILASEAEEAIAAIQEIHEPKNEEIMETPACIPHSIISKGMIIKGDIQCVGIVELEGEVGGDVNGGDELNITGKVNGNIEGQNVEINEGTVIGNINASGTVAMSRNSHVTGNIKAKSLIVDGVVNGDVTLDDSLSMDDHGIVIGKVTANRMSVANGAIVQGEVVIRSANSLARSWD